MNILLVHPETPDTFWSMRHALKVLGKRASSPPLGLITVAAMLPNHWEVRLVDTNVRRVTRADLDWADYGFVTAMKVQEQSARKVIAQIRDAGVPVVAGGPLFTHEWELFPEVEHFVLNEAELTLPRFIADAENGSLERVYAAPDTYAEMEHSPIPDWDLVSSKNYHYGVVQYSRGCPFHCDFCDVTALLGHRPRVKKPEQIIAELDRILATGDYNFIFFADDNLIGNKKEVKNELLPALIEWRRRRQPPVYFGTQVSINLADDEKLMKLMLEAGFRHLIIGIETPEEDSLLASRKSQNIKRDLLENVDRLHGSGFIVIAGFVVGFDTDTPDTFRRQRDFIQESGIVMAPVNLLKAPPGTALYERMKSEGRLLEHFTFDEWRTNFVPAMEGDALYRGYDWLIDEIYSPDQVFARTRRFLEHYQPPNVDTHIPDPPVQTLLGTAARVLWYVGRSRPEGRYLFQLVWWALRHDRRLLDQAVFNAIMMYQLRLLHESYVAERATGDGAARARTTEPVPA